MSALMAVGAIRATVGTESELTNSKIVECTKAFDHRLNQCETLETGAIQRAIDANASLFRICFQTFNLNILPCVWEELKLFEFTHSQWAEVISLVSEHEPPESCAEPRPKIRRIGSENTFGGLSSAASTCSSSQNCSVSASPKPSEASGTASFSGPCTFSFEPSTERRLIENLQKQLEQQKGVISMLSSIIADNQTNMGDMKTKVRTAQQGQRRAEEKLAEAQGELAAERAKKLHGLMISKTSDIYQKRKSETAGLKMLGKWEWLTPQGSLALGIRKNFSNIGTADLGLTLCEDISRWTVARMELRVSACMVADSWNFFRNWKQNACDDVSKSLQPVTIISFRQDGTNSGIWNKSKLIALELEAAYKLDIPAESCRDPDKSPWQNQGCDVSSLQQNWSRLKRLADVQIVKQGSGGATLALTQKMLNSLGCPHWGDFGSKEERASGTHRTGLFLDRRSTGFLFC